MDHHSKTKEILQETQNKSDISTMCEMKRSSSFSISILAPRQTNHWPVADCTAHLDEQRPPGTLLQRGKKLINETKSVLLPLQLPFTNGYRVCWRQRLCSPLPLFGFSLSLCVCHIPNPHSPRTNTDPRFHISK